MRLPDEVREYLKLVETEASCKANEARINELLSIIPPGTYILVNEPGRRWELVIYPYPRQAQ